MNNIITKDVWYWPGRKRDPCELSILLFHLAKSGNSVKAISTPYDSGPLPSDTASDAHQEMACSDTKRGDWWIGLSLGAAVAYIVCSTICTEKRPARLTLINPFADRIELSKLCRFSLESQWLLQPDKFSLPEEIAVDFVLSTSDRRIPTEQGLRLHSFCRTQKTQIIWVDSDHIISNHYEQQRLAMLLLSTL